MANFSFGTTILLNVTFSVFKHVINKHQENQLAFEILHIKFLIMISFIKPYM